MKKPLPPLTLAAILMLGAVLRFWHLAEKPLWADEVITALFSLGHTYYDVPLSGIFPVSALEQVFTLKPDTTCAQIVQTVSTQSVHPPLFFCWLHQWLTWIQPLGQSWVWQLRAFPAVIGVGAIAALYQLNRVLFSRSAGLLGAALMAVSPFAVYLSQEARHYTLPMLLVILALLATYQLDWDLERRQFRPAVWLGWIAVNSLGFYVHYFFLLAVMAQVVTLVLMRPQRSALRAIALAVLGVGLTYVPWLPTFLSHSSRPETDWLKLDAPHWFDAIAPLYQLPVSWVLMVIALPIEHQPIWIALPAGLLMVAFAVWLLGRLVGRLKRLWRDPTHQTATRLLGIYSGVVMLAFLAIAYLLGKDLTQVPRYSFIYFPALCALLGACLSQSPRPHPELEDLPLDTLPTVTDRGFLSKTALIVLLVGVVSSGCVVSNLAFQKPYYPDHVAANLRLQPERSRLVGMGYADFQDVALGLSFALALHQADQQQPTTPPSQFAFLARSPDYDPIWRSLPQLKTTLPFPLNLWIVAPGLGRKDFPTQLTLGQVSGTAQQCQRDPAQYYRIGIPYQLYRCGQG